MVEEIAASQINPQKGRAKKAVEKEIRSTYMARNTQNAAQDIIQKETIKGRATFKCCKHRKLWRENRSEKNLPVLGNVKRPFKQQVSLVIVIEEFGDSIVVASRHHARRSLLGVD